MLTDFTFDDTGETVAAPIETVTVTAQRDYTYLSIGLVLFALLLLPESRRK